MHGADDPTFLYGCRAIVSHNTKPLMDVCHFQPLKTWWPSQAIASPLTEQILNI